MVVSVQIVNFPKAQHLRNSVVKRIQECAEHFHGNILRVQAVFQRSGLLSQLKFYVHGKNFDTSISAASHNFSYALDKGLQKLENVLRKSSNRTKQRRQRYFSKFNQDST